jgi:hypothetical protein
MLKHSFKIYGIWGLVLTFIAAIIIASVKPESWNLTSLYGITIEILGFLSLAIIAFSKEEKDDEYLTHIRTKSIYFTVLLSFIYAILDSYFFVISHLMIMEVFQFQILAYILIFNILKRTYD